MIPLANNQVTSAKNSHIFAQNECNLKALLGAGPCESGKRCVAAIANSARITSASTQPLDYANATILSNSPRQFGSFGARFASDHVQRVQRMRREQSKAHEYEAGERQQTGDAGKPQHAGDDGG